MAAGYNPSSIIGGPLDKKVLDQLDQRQNLYTKKDYRTADELIYLNSKTGWVKLSSSVNVLKKDKNGKVIESSTSAKNNILFGGTFKDESTTPRGGINFNGVSSRTAYNKYDSTGFRPMPGITSFQIDSKNRFGTLREATVDFQVWSVEQLTEFESLYLRPGFTVLLEWGHSMYLDNKGRVQKTPPTTVANYFSNGKTKEQVQEEIKKFKDQSSQNYDAVFGYIKNFLWSYRTDGGYDCRLSIVSAGELIESVQVSLSTSQTGQKVTKTTSTGDTDDSSIKTPIHNFLNAINDVPRIIKGLEGEANRDKPENSFEEFKKRVKESLEVRAGITLDKFLNEKRTNFGPVPDDLPVSFSIIKLKAALDATSIEAKTGIGKQDMRFITFLDLMALINAAFLIKDKSEKNLFSFDLTPEQQLFYTFPDHIGLDPGICILPKSSTNNVSLSYTLSGANQTNQSSTNEDEFNPNTSILYIQLNIDFVIGKLNSVLSQAEPDRTVINFVNSILTSLSNNLGNINNFGLHYEEDNFKYYIVDRSLTPDKNHLAKSFINLTGLRSTVTNISLSSKLSPKIASMIAISAQDQSADVGEDVENMFRWNDGLLDRVVGEKNFINLPDKETKRNQIIDSIKLLGDAIRLFNETGSYSSLTFQNLVTVHKDITRYMSRLYNNSKINSGAPGIIPFDLTITLDGIGGIKIGQAFRINEGILPGKYNGVVAFLVTGISHVVQNNKWNTELKGQTIIISRTTTTEEYNQEALITQEQLQVILAGEREIGDPNIPLKIIDLEKERGVPVYDTYNSQITVDQLLARLNDDYVIQASFRAFFEELQKNYQQYTIYINATYRSLERSYELKYVPEKAGDDFDINNAEPASSSHNYAMGVDMNVVTPSGITLRKKTTKSLWRQTEIPTLGINYGIKWAGDFMDDDVHFGSRYYNQDYLYQAVIDEIKGHRLLNDPNFYEYLPDGKTLNWPLIQKEVFEKRGIFFNKKIIFDLLLFRGEFANFATPDYKEKNLTITGYPEGSANQRAREIVSANLANRENAKAFREAGLLD